MGVFLVCRNVSGSLDGAGESCRWNLPNVFRYLELWRAVVRNNDIWEFSLSGSVQSAGVGFREEWTKDHIAVSVSRKAVSLCKFNNYCMVT